MGFKKYSVLAAYIVVLYYIFTPASSFAHRPLTTQDAYPVDVHKIKLETGVRFFNFPGDDEAYNLDMELNYGIVNNLDVGVEIPYVFWRPGKDKDIDAVGDMILKSRLLFLKGREGNPISLTIQPFFKVPAPEDKMKMDRGGPSTGETDFGFAIIATREMAPLVAHMNLGYIFINRPSGEDYENVFSFKLALEYKAESNIEIVGELTAETNKVSSDEDIFSMLLGTRYIMWEGVSVDAGYSIGLSDSHSGPDSTATLGFTMDF